MFYSRLRYLILAFASLLLTNGYSQLMEGDYLPAEFHAGRRDALRKQMPPNSVAVFFANPERNRANDVEYLYHQDPNFYYLTGYNEPNSVLLIFSDPQTDADGTTYSEILFAQHRDPDKEMWNGKRLGIEGARQKLEIDKVLDNRNFMNTDIAFASFDKVFFFGFQEDIRDSGRDRADLFSLISDFRNKAGIPGNFSPLLQVAYNTIADPQYDLDTRQQQIYSLSNRNPALLDDQYVHAFLKASTVEEALNVIAELPAKNLDQNSLNRFMAKLRQEKTNEEIALMKKAVRISCIGQIEVMKAMQPGMSESEIQGIHEFVFKKYGCESEGYPSIVGSGSNGCILHYIENNKRHLDIDLVLMDVGAEYHGYTADVTRTIPANGTFSEEQKAIYQVVLEAQEAAFLECRPGREFYAPHLAATRVIREGLERLGIIIPGQRHNYFPHSTSHYLGLDVHDPGTNGQLLPGQVITVEPGIYIPPGSPCDEKWWGIAVRIEDDILITAEGMLNLSESAPRTVEAIETMMSQPSALDDFNLPDLD